MNNKSAFIPGLLLITSFSFAPNLIAELSVQGGGGSCAPVISLITRHWMDVKQVMLPVKAKLRRPKQEDLFCISPYYLRTALERRVGRETYLRCFTNPGDSMLGICCDLEQNSCAQLRPDVVPEVAKRTKRKARPSGSNSSWVTPPSEKDQWKTNSD